MLNDGVKTKVGIYLYGNVLRMIETQKEDDTIKIVRIAEQNLNTPLDHTVLHNEEVMLEYISALNTIIESEKITPGSAYLALDHRLAIEHVVAFDNDLDDSKLLDQVEWESGQSFISSREEYNIDYEKIVTLGSGIDRYLMVAVRKKIIKFFQQLFSNTKFRLTQINLDKLAAVKTYQLLQQPSEIAALVNCENKSYDIIIIQDGEFVVSETLSYIDKEYEAEDLNRVARDICHKINNHLQQISNVVNTGNFSTVYFFGERLNRRLLSEVEQFQNQFRAVRFDPFQNIQQDLDSDASSYLQNNSERFVYCLGMVI